MSGLCIDYISLIEAIHYNEYQTLKMNEYNW
jgi:hypothetical protein